jgi:ribosome-associated protein
MPQDTLKVNRTLTLPGREIGFDATTSSGPGGQHANRSATAVELTFDVAGSPTLSGAQKNRIMKALSSRLDSRGVLRVRAADERSQKRNLERARSRLADLLRRGLRRPAPRKPTRPTAAARRSRLEAKKRRGQRKRMRAKPAPDD